MTSLALDMRQARALPANIGASQKSPTRVLVAALAVALPIAAATTNPTLALATVVAAAVVGLLVGTRRFAPILVFVCLAQWLQASSDTWHANFNGLDVNDLFASWSVDDAVTLSLMSVVVLAAGMRAALMGCRAVNDDAALLAANKLQLRRVFGLYFVVTLFCLALHAIAFDIPRLSQTLIGFIGIKWVMFFILTAAVVCQRRCYALFAFALVFELVIGATGFFSTFKTVILVFLLAAVSLRRQRTGRLWGLGAWGVVTLIILGVLWSAIKVDYRDYVNQGTRQQIVSVPVTDRLATIGSMVLSLDGEDLQTGVQRLVERLGYVQYFAYVLDNVPANIPHQSGDLWWASVEHISMPRLLFPDKDALPLDTEITEKYTQRRIITQSTRFTNIPIGYVGESYIDFGRWLMFLPILLVGLGIGLIYRAVMSNPTYPLTRIAFVSVMLMEFNRLELSSPKLLGGVGISVAVLSIVMWCLSKPLMDYLNGDHAGVGPSTT